MCTDTPQIDSHFNLIILLHVVLCRLIFDRASLLEAISVLMGNDRITTTVLTHCEELDAIVMMCDMELIN